MTAESTQETPETGCKAPKRHDRPKGRRCGHKPRPETCPRWGVACLNHNQHPKVRTIRERQGRGGPKTSAALEEGGREGPDAYREAVLLLEPLTDVQKTAAKAYAETGDLATAASRADVDEDDLETWLESEQGRAVVAVMKRYRLSAVADRLEVAIVEGIDRLATLVRGTDVAGELIGGMKIMIAEYARIVDAKSTDELDKLRARLEALEEDTRPQ